MTNVMGEDTTLVSVLKFAVCSKVMREKLDMIRLVHKNSPDQSGTGNIIQLDLKGRLQINLRAVTSMWYSE